jgi:heme A synthase
MDLFRVLLTIHSIVRWVAIVVAFVAVVWFLMVWLGGRRNERADRGLMSAFAGMLDTQVLLGILLIITGGGLVSYRIEHAVTMILAVIVAHLPRRWRGAEPSIRARNNLIAIVVALVLIFIGVSRLPGGWSR